MHSVHTTLKTCVHTAKGKKCVHRDQYTGVFRTLLHTLPTVLGQVELYPGQVEFCSGQVKFTIEHDTKVLALTMWASASKS